MKRLIAVLLLAALSVPAGLFAAETFVPRQPTPVDTLAGDLNRYDISFLWFDRLAVGELSFAAMETVGHYRAVLEARTVGVMAWLTGHRVHRYVSTMERLADGRLRTLRHESHVLKGAGKKIKNRIKEYRYDYTARVVNYRRTQDGQSDPVQHLAMGAVSLNDFLTVFCNFRLGYHGFPGPGDTLALATFEQGKPATIQVTAPLESSPAQQKFIPEGGRLFQVRMGEDLLGTGGGGLYLWFDAASRPVRMVVEGVVGIGNVRGVLQETESSPVRM